jgi:dihydrofolate reductase
MTTEFKELLSASPEEKAQIWLIGSREQVQQLIDECYVRKLALDRVQFTPIVPVPFIPGKFMSVLVR